MVTTVLIAVVTALVGVGTGYALRRLVLLSRKSSLEIEIKEKKLAAKEKASEIIQKAEQKAEEITKTARKEISEKEDRLNKREDELSDKQERLNKKEEKLEKKQDKLEAQKNEVRVALSEISNLSPTEAKEQLFEQIKKEHEQEVRARRKKLEMEGEESIKKRAREMLANVVERLSRSVTPNLLSTEITLKEDDLKGKIIGKEGRNIRAFQQATGVELVIDDTPKTVTISSYDPVRRAVAKHALEDLLKDGRVQPARIERFVNDAKKKVDKIIQNKGEEAVHELNLLSLDERVVSILGRLHFRTSYGQNVLQHSIETAHIAEMLAHELNIDAEVAKTGALLHDIGKAVDHELKGSHVELGMHVLKKFGVEEAVINAMKSHHDDYSHESLEAVVVQIADNVSGARPGARKQSFESYVERLEEFETIAKDMKGVVNSYTVEAGREVRVFVNSKKISDAEAKKIARNIATKIEKRVNYPGEVKVHVIRETRLTHYAK